MVLYCSNIPVFERFDVGFAHCGSEMNSEVEGASANRRSALLLSVYTEHGLYITPDRTHKVAQTDQWRLSNCLKYCKRIRNDRELRV
jgi:hypothetical protein